MTKCVVPFKAHLNLRVRNNETLLVFKMSHKKSYVIMYFVVIDMYTSWYCEMMFCNRVCDIRWFYCFRIKWYWRICPWKLYTNNRNNGLTMSHAVFHSIVTCSENKLLYTTVDFKIFFFFFVQCPRCAARIYMYNIYIYIVCHIIRF